MLGGGRDTKQFKDNLSQIGQDLEDNGRDDLKNVTKHLKKGGSRFGNFLETVTFGVYKTTETKAKAELAALQPDNPLAKDLGVAMEARNLADSSTLFADSQNVNLELTAKMTLIRNSVKLKNGALNTELPAKAVKAYPNDINFCKSGKDRTGYVQMKNTQTVVASHLGIDPQSERGQKNFIRQVAGGHTQEMAGVQGGTIGCHSIKTNPEFGLNSEDRAIDGIVNQKSSHFNSKIKTDKKPEKAMQEFEASFAQHQEIRAQSRPTVEGRGNEQQIETPSIDPPLARAAITIGSTAQRDANTRVKSSSTRSKPQTKSQNTEMRR